MTSEYIDELEKVGYHEVVEFQNLNDAGYFYVHRACATWSIGVIRDAPTGTLSNVAASVTQNLAKKCSFCLRFGASMACKMSCPQYFHLPCIAASGGFQVIQNYTLFCKDHLGQVAVVCIEDVNCRACNRLGDVSNLMMCTLCGDHYHGTCLRPEQSPQVIVRTGWQCKSCRHCQICRVPDATEGRCVPCELCDKIYHANCLRPIMTSIPKNRWRCRCCRVCSDCGSRSPGAGTSSRWHAHYTVCDSCYQQRNKGFSCPICFRAYRAAAHREMVKCSSCNKYVHHSCDAEADLTAFHRRQSEDPRYVYECPPCKSQEHSGRLVRLNSGSNLDDESMSASQESLYAEDPLAILPIDLLDPIAGTSGPSNGNLAEKISPADYGLGKGKPFAASKVAKKRLGLPLSQAGRPKGSGKNAFQKRQRVAEFGRKRGPKAKMRGIFGVPGLGLQRPTYDTSNAAAASSAKASDDEIGIENRLVLCSAKDKFVLTQDICVMCGAIGTDQEGCLIACAQCGQCYHPYCVTVKVTKVILEKGWRCLDCTVCEGCGQKHDEGRLILCDDCDISYHIYCMDPPLDIVPHGNWKCKWCAVCQKCGANTPGTNCVWQNSFTECGPCASQVSCPHCSEGYADGELIIQCTQCDRWLHCSCDQIKNEDDAEVCSEVGYTCLLCRPKDAPPAHLVPKKSVAAIMPPPQKLSPTLKSQDDADFPLSGPETNHYIDGVCLSDRGLHHIKSLQMELIRKKRKNKPVAQIEVPPVFGSADKDAGILAAIESVVAGSSLDNSLEDIKLEPLDPREEAEIYKDGMVWDKADSTPPEGFTLCTTEAGVLVLRKKRQRNLQKVGIGGFIVRNRSVRKDNGTAVKEENEDISETNGELPHFTTTPYIDVVDRKKKTTSSMRRKQKSAKLTETYPSYLQEAFFGKGLLVTTKPKFESSSSDDDSKSNVSDDKTIKLSMEELKMIESMRAKQQQQQADEQKKVAAAVAATPLATGAAKPMDVQHSTVATTDMSGGMMMAGQQTHHQQHIVRPQTVSQQQQVQSTPSIVRMDEADALKDLLPTDLLDTNDLVNTIMNDDDELVKAAGGTFDDIIPDDQGMIAGDHRKDELADILSPHFKLEFRMDGKDVEEIFKGVLTDESQVSRCSDVVICINPYLFAICDYLKY